MKGRSRPFAIRNARQDDATILTVGLHDNCDALVATAVLERGELAAAEPLVMRLPQQQDRRGLGRGHARALAKTKRAACATRLLLKNRSTFSLRRAEARTPRSR